MNVSALVVVYNQSIDDIACLGDLLEAPCVKEVIVCDNSTTHMGNRERAMALGVTYVDMGGNLGLSKAYNEGIVRAAGDVICLFDDDTAIESGYFETLEQLARGDEAWDVLLPLVRAGELILSPCSYDGYRTHAFPAADAIVDGDRLSGINSGMAVRRRVYETVRYDEGLFLDLIDHRFIEDARQAGFIVRYGRGMELRQDFSLVTDSLEGALRRLEIFSADARTFYDDTLLRRAYCAVMLAYRRVRLCLKYRTARFLFA